MFILSLTDFDVEWCGFGVALQTGYMKSRQDLLSSIQDTANDANAAATLVWQVYAWPIESHDTYNFDWSQPGNEALRTQIELMKQKVRGPVHTWGQTSLGWQNASLQGCCFTLRGGRC